MISVTCIVDVFSDIAPEADNLATTNAVLDDVSDLALQLMQETGIRLLWGTCNLFSHPRYMNGAATNPDAHVVAYAAAAVKKGLEVAKKLGAENYGEYRSFACQNCGKHCSLSSAYM